MSAGRCAANSVMRRRPRGSCGAQLRRAWHWRRPPGQQGGQCGRETRATDRMRGRRLQQGQDDAGQGAVVVRHDQPNTVGAHDGASVANVPRDSMSSSVVALASGRVNGAVQANSPQGGFHRTYCRTVTEVVRTAAKSLHSAPCWRLVMAHVSHHTQHMNRCTYFKLTRRKPVDTASEAELLRGVNGLQNYCRIQPGAGCRIFRGRILAPRVCADTAFLLR